MSTESYHPNTAGPLTVAWQNYKKSWKQWGTRATRREYWLSMLIWWIISSMLFSCFINMGYPVYRQTVDTVFLVRTDGGMYPGVGCNVWALVSAIVILLCFMVPTLGISMRRFYDAGKPGRWYLFVLVALWVLYVVASCLVWDMARYCLFIPFLLGGLVMLFCAKASQKDETVWDAAHTCGQDVVGDTQEMPQYERVTWKNALSYSGYYSRMQFAVHVAIAGVLAVALSFVVGWNCIVPDFGGGLTFGTYWSTCCDLGLFSEKSFMLLMFGLTELFVLFMIFAAPAYVKRCRDMGTHGVLFIVWVVLGLLSALPWQYLLGVEKSLIVIQSFSIIFAVWLGCLLLAACCLTPGKNVPHQQAAHSGIRRTLVKSILLPCGLASFGFIFTFPPMVREVSSLCLSHEKRMWVALEMKDVDCLRDVLSLSSHRISRDALSSALFCYRKQLDLNEVRLFIRSGANPHVGGGKGTTIYWEALKNQNVKLLEELSKYTESEYAKVDSISGRPAHFSTAEEENMQCVIKWVVAEDDVGYLSVLLDIPAFESVVVPKINDFIDESKPKTAARLKMLNRIKEAAEQQREWEWRQQMRGRYYSGGFY